MLGNWLTYIHTELALVTIFDIIWLNYLSIKFELKNQVLVNNFWKISLNMAVTPFSIKVLHTTSEGNPLPCYHTCYWLLLKLSLKELNTLPISLYTVTTISPIYSAIRQQFPISFYCQECQGFTFVNTKNNLQSTFIPTTLLSLLIIVFYTPFASKIWVHLHT